MSGLLARVRAAWAGLQPERRLAAAAALALCLTLLLPWYQLTARGRGGGLATKSLSAFQDFSWVEAAVLLVAVAVLALLFARAERRAFHLPGGDGSVILAAGGWATLLLVWRAFDKPSGNGVASVGLEWGFLFAFAAAGALAYAGWRVRGAHRPEPPNPAAEPPPTAVTSPLAPAPPAPEPPTAATRPLRRRPPAPGPAADQLPLTAAHGSEEPLPRDDGTLDLGDERD